MQNSMSGPRLSVALTRDVSPCKGCVKNVEKPQCHDWCWEYWKWLNMKGYKGFNPGLICKGKQYQENTVFEEPEAEICEKGMHFCENPFDVLDYYDLIRSDGTPNEFAEVEALDDPKTDDHKKFCTKKLKVGVKLGLSGFIKACVDFVLEKAIAETPDENFDSGNSAHIGSSGEGARINCTGRDSVICCAGHGSVVKAQIGCWITLAEWKYDGEKGRSVPVCVKTEYVDGEKIKADTPYMLKNGEFVEAKSDGD